MLFNTAIDDARNNAFLFKQHVINHVNPAQKAVDNQPENGLVSGPR